MHLRFIIILCALVGVSCTHSKELQQTQEELAQTRLTLEEVEVALQQAEENLLTCDNLRKTQEEYLTTKMDILVEEIQPRFFDAGLRDDYLSSPCDIEVRVISIDTTRSWAFVHYRVMGESRVSPHLSFAATGSSSTADRSSLRIVHQGLDHDVLLSVENCTEASCSLSCRVLPVGG
jgi:hypothetical protein